MFVAEATGLHRCLTKTRVRAQDIAFIIVNKEWEYSFKRGFKCTFERGYEQSTRLSMMELLFHILRVSLC